MSCCGGSCGCEKKEGASKKKDSYLESREVGKLCPVCNAEYLASGPFLKKKSEGPDTTHCTECGAEEVWAYLAKCWCGATIRPRDVACRYHGHKVCQHETYPVFKYPPCYYYGHNCPPEMVRCPGWHDYTKWFGEK